MDGNLGDFSQYQMWFGVKRYYIFEMNICRIFELYVNCIGMVCDGYV